MAMVTRSTTRTVEGKAPTRQDLIDAVTALHRCYPQYIGHWDKCMRVQITQSVVTKAGTAFLPGEVTLMHVEDDFTRQARGLTHGLRSCYSFRNRMDTSVPVEAIKVVTTDWHGDATEVTEVRYVNKCDVCQVEDYPRTVMFWASDDGKRIVCMDCKSLGLGDQ